MKYHRLTEAQFHEMHEEFSIFLATNSIDKKKWDCVKKETPTTVSFLLDEFSDLVWEKILTQCSYLEFITPKQLFLFWTKEVTVDTLVLKVTNVKHDLTTSEGFNWMLSNLSSNRITLFKASREYEPRRNDFIYSYLKKGAVLSDGLYFKQLKSYFSNSIK
tara:strand:- start:915 stop:1397 length:483 start_codon:yes stop_codon:yes gene_type:complete